MLSGIYCIENLLNNKKYIGSSNNIEKRKRTHFYELERKNHGNIKLQKSYDKYGKDIFIFYVLEEVGDLNNLITREQYYIDKLNPYFNICKIANSSLGTKRSDETKERIRQANLGLKHPEWRNKIKGESQSGENHWTKTKNFSIESKTKMSETHKKLYENGYTNPNKGCKKNKEQIENLINKISKVVIQYTLDEVFVKEWKSATEASLCGFNPSHIVQCCLNKRKTHKKFIWKRKTM
jgi:group I intron endonuclease